MKGGNYYVIFRYYHVRLTFPVGHTMDSGAVEEEEDESVTKARTRSYLIGWMTGRGCCTLGWPHDARVYNRNPDYEKAVCVVSVVVYSSPLPQEDPPTERGMCVGNKSIVMAQSSIQTVSIDSNFIEFPIMRSSVMGRLRRVTPFISLYSVWD